MNLKKKRNLFLKMENPYLSNFRIITVNFSGVRIFTACFFSDEKVSKFPVVSAEKEIRQPFILALSKDMGPALHNGKDVC